MRGVIHQSLTVQHPLGRVSHVPTVPARIAQPSPPSQGKVQPCRSSNQVAVCPPCRRQPHRVAQAATRPSPQLPSSSRPAWRIPRHTRPALIGDLHPDEPIPGQDCDRDRPARTSPERLCRTLFPNNSLVSKTATSPHWCPGPSTPVHELTGDPDAFRPPGNRYALPDHRSHQCTRPSRPPGPGILWDSGPGIWDAPSTLRAASSRDTRPARAIRGRPAESQSSADEASGERARRFVETAVTSSRPT